MVSYLLKSVMLDDLRRCPFFHRLPVFRSKTDLLSWTLKPLEFAIRTWRVWVQPDLSTPNPVPSYSSTPPFLAPGDSGPFTVPKTGESRRVSLPEEWSGVRRCDGTSLTREGRGRGKGTIRSTRRAPLFLCSVVRPLVVQDNRTSGWV